MEAAKRDQLLLLAQATTMVVVAKDGNGNYWSIGDRKRCFLSNQLPLQVELHTVIVTGYEIVIGGLEASPMFTVLLL